MTGAVVVAGVRGSNPSRSPPVGFTRHTCGDRGHAGDGLHRTRASIVDIGPPRGSASMPPRLSMSINL